MVQKLAGLQQSLIDVDGDNRDRVTTPGSLVVQW